MYNKVLSDRGSTKSIEKANKFNQETSKERLVSKAVDYFDPSEVYTSESIMLWHEKIPSNPEKIRHYIKPQGNGKELFEKLCEEEEYIYDPEDAKNQDYSLMGKPLFLKLIKNLVHN